MRITAVDNARKRHWALDDIPFDRIDRDKIQRDENLFYCSGRSDR